MKLEIIETPDYILAVSNEKPTVGNQFIYETDTQTINTTCSDYTPNEFDFIIIAYQPKGNVKELDLPLLPEMVVGDDVEKLAEKEFPLLDTKWCRTGVVEEENLQLLGHRRTFIKGHKAATKVYSEEDLRKAFERGFSVATYLADYETEKEWSKFIQPLKQPKWFVAEMKCGRCYIPLKDDDCWSAKECSRNSKNDLLLTTTINDKTYLVGTYK